MKHIIFFIFVLTATMYTFAQESVSSPIIKGKDNKNLEFFKSNKLQSPISPTSIFGQEIRGVVYDKKTNEVLIGASVIEVGSSNGTITDIDGQHSIKLSNSDKKILQASYLGYVVKQERVGNRKVVNFFLEEDQVTISNK
ncbi:MAG TPA: carboxypeptidase-like regulatory domain-containing protein [Candidatus Bacteroides intestinigallinarum]|nr:carboxypeptidase-like regulatory domain-containing protein [Candidatus Bacteroides intestinigallinarum]